MTEVSVVVCTRNRADRLRTTLKSLERQVAPGADWEVVVVDNASDDETPAVAADFMDLLPLRLERESRLGLSNARNRGIAEAVGEVIVWIDDDVLVGDRWLASWIEGVRDHPNAAFFGAGIAVRFASPPPSWIVDCWDRFAPLFAERVIPSAGGRVEPGYLPFGANYAVRAEVQRANPYDPALGRRGAALYGGEETTLLEALMAQGHSGRWIAGAELEHVIGPERVDTTRLAAQIRQNARLLGEPPRTPDGRPLTAGQLRRAWIRNAILWRGLRGGRADRWVPRFIEAAVWRGHLDRAQAEGNGPEGQS